MEFYYDTTLKSKHTIVGYLDTCKSPQTVIIRTPKRSTAQNSTLHDNIQILAEASGYTPDQMKLILKQSITNTGDLKMVTVTTTSPKKGEGVTVYDYRSTADLDTKEFTILLEYVFRIGESIGLKMHRPDDLLQMAKEIF